MFKIECDLEDKMWGGKKEGRRIPAKNSEGLSQCTYQRLNINFLQTRLPSQSLWCWERTQDFAYARRARSMPEPHSSSSPTNHCYPLLRRDVVCVGLIARFYFDLRCCVLSKLFSHILPFWLLVSLCWAKRVHQACSPVQFHRAFSAGLATIAISKMRHKWVFV